jgi:hypothetical protein
MSLPYEYRDYPLAIFMGFAFVVGGVMTFCAEPSQSVEITLENACCSTRSCPVVESLTALPASERIRHTIGDATTTVSLRTSRATSVRELWDTVEAAQGRPIRMVVDNREYVCRPIN